jgi:hypothetical protein
MAMIAGSWESQLKTVEKYAAFTVAELGEMLPKRIKDEPMGIGFDESIWHLGYGKYALEESRKEADARAKMLIYLVENGFITL